MKKLLKIATFLIACYALSTGAWSQKVYKCGSSYSPAPCAEGTAVNVEDERSQADKAAADQATKRNIKVGSALEKSRLADEKSANAANDKQAAQKEKEARKAKKAKDEATKLAQSPSGHTLNAPKKNKSKATDPEFFTAKSPTEKK
jgi:hypothetical protein